MNFIIPVIVVFGFYNISSKINNKLNLKINDFFFSIFSFLIFLGVVVILLILKINLQIIKYPLIIILFISFLNFLFENKKNLTEFIQNQKIQFYLYSSLSLLTLIPISGADSYAYHLAWPQNLLENPQIFFDKLFLESRVIGMGEIVNYLGLLLGTENLLSFLSFSSLFFYILIFKPNNKNIIFIILLASPIFYKYLIDQKPFILPCVFLIIFLENLFNKIAIKKVNNFDLLSFFITLVFFGNTKYPFLLIAFFIFLFFLIVSLRSGFFWKYFSLGIIVFIFYFLPIPVMKYIIFLDPFSPFLEGIINNGDQDIIRLREMYKNWDGFKVSKNFTDYDHVFSLIRNLLNFFVPIAPYTILDTFGASVIFIFFARFNNNLKLNFFISILFIISLMVIFTNFQSRWFLFILLYLVLTYEYVNLKLKYFDKLKKIFLIIATVLLSFHFFYFAYVFSNTLLNGFDDTLKKRVYLYKEYLEIKNKSQTDYILTNTRGNYFSKNIIQFKYPNYSKELLKNHKNLDNIKYGFFSTGTNRIDNKDIFKKTTLSSFDPTCVELIYNKLNIVAKRNIFSRKDYENFILVKFVKPLNKCMD